MIRYYALLPVTRPIDCRIGLADGLQQFVNEWPCGSD